MLHPPNESEANNRHTADSDLLAIRFPHVYEEIGGQPEDGDSTRFTTWGFSLLVTTRMIDGHQRTTCRPVSSSIGELSMDSQSATNSSPVKTSIASPLIGLMFGLP